MNTSTTLYKEAGQQWLKPVLLSGSTLQRIAIKPENFAKVLATLTQLERDDYLTFILEYYHKGLNAFGDAWGYCDLLLALQAASILIKPTNYLEIGVRRGRSLAIAAVANPQMNLFGFDLWVQNYAGMENPGPEFVQSELKKLGHKGTVQFISGDSKDTVPQFFADHPNMMFDMITIDGDHSEEGARRDLMNTINHLAVGGVLFMDDICHPQHRYLNTLWDEFFINNEHFSCSKYTELGYGIAMAIRLD